MWSAQQPDGGFSGRAGVSDLYYTSFALRTLAVLGQLEGERAEQAGRFLVSQLTQSTTTVDFLSLIYGAKLLEAAAGVDVFAGAQSDWPEQVARTLETLRRDDGGYAKGPEGQASSTYHTFLVTLALELIGAPLLQPERIVHFILGQRRDDGGFVEIRPMRRGGANPTAAALGVLRVVDALSEPIRTGAIKFLSEMQTDEGGMRASTRIPIADLLSTFTATLSLADLGGLEAVDTGAVRRFAESLAQPDGGFLAAAWDEVTDVEYTFYGLGVLGLLTSPDSR